jgi:hypothetical protein
MYIYSLQSCSLNLQVDHVLAPPKGNKLTELTSVTDTFSLASGPLVNGQSRHEAINRGRALIASETYGTRKYALACADVAHQLHLFYNETGDANMLHEAIQLGRESLAFTAEEHPERTQTYANLARLLRAQYERNGDGDLLLEATDLDRMVLSLNPIGHPERPISCMNLAVSLGMRYEHTGDDYLLYEMIDLERESLSLIPQGHPARARACNDLAVSLRTRLERHEGEQLLDEVVDLERECLRLTPEGHPDRALACRNLAISLRKVYEDTADEALIWEATEFARISLALCSSERHDLGRAFEVLSTLLKITYQRTLDDRLLDEIIDWHQITLHSALSDPQNITWRNATTLAWVYLQRRSKSFNLGKAIQYLSQCLDHPPDTISQAVMQVLELLDDVWSVSEYMPDEYPSLSIVYQKLIHLLPLMSPPELKHLVQLRGQRTYSRLGSEAFIVSVIVNQWPMGLEILELYQGILWSQRLHHRDSQLMDIPWPLQSTLSSLIKTVATPSIVPELSQMSHGTRHHRTTRLYGLLKQIRALPGLERFMLGETTASLCSVAATHPVAVLVGTRGHYYALLISSEDPNCTLLNLDWSDQEFRDLSFQQPQGQSYPRAFQNEDAVTTMAHNTTALSILWSRRMQHLWLKLVKPILDRLGLLVWILLHIR